jgi:subtilisin family serine protease
VAFQRAFKARAEVEFAELDRLHPAQQMIPNDPLYGNENSWSLPKVDALDAWTINTGSSNVIIAVLDSGVDATHPDLASQIVPGWNVYNNNSDTSDVCGHGTAVAGAAAAASNNAIGVASIAWGCRIMPVRISDTLSALSLLNFNANRIAGRNLDSNGNPKNTSDCVSLDSLGKRL